MVLWRISNYSTLDGVGGLKASGRWHNRGCRVVYLSQSPASALLEILVHLEIRIDDLPKQYKLLQIHVPDSVRIERVEQTVKLLDNWKQDIAATRRLGDSWLKRDASALLEVPSALVPHTSNFLLNPRHKDSSSITVVSVTEHSFDSRLLR